MRRLLLTVVTVLLLSVGTAWAGPLEDGVAAYQRGDYATALRIYRPLAAQGNASAQSNLGLMYALGRGVAQNYAEAVKWFRLAAAQGDAGAQLTLGFMYDNGQGVTQDYAEAVKWYRLAAAQGLASAQYNLGVTYETGKASRRTTQKQSSGIG
jgi:TPR repeat protein